MVHYLNGHWSIEEEIIKNFRPIVDPIERGAEVENHLCPPEFKWVVFLKL